jgi:uncharacterized protein
MIDLKQIPISLIEDDRSEVDAELTNEDLDLEDDFIHFEGALRLSGGIYKVGTEILLEGDLKGTRIKTCSRCLDEVRENFEEELMLGIERPNDKFLNAVPFIRDEILVSVPIHVLCHENCRGLCPACGINLNHGSCECREEKITSEKREF